MDLPRLPIWLAYIIAPALILLLCLKVVIHSESPIFLGAMCVGCGWLRALVLHAYIFVKARLFGDR